VRRLLVLAGLCPVLLLVVLPSGAAAAVPALASPVVVDGPSADIVSLNGMSVARDGTGGLVYVKNVAGVAHVFVSALTGGVFQPSQQIDAAFIGPSFAPVIAAGNDGVLLISFINGGQLYVVDRSGPATAYSAPLELAAGASGPSLQITPFGKGYLAFTATVAGASNVRAAYFYAGHWSLEPAPLNAVPNDDAGLGSGRPQVAAAGDGVAVVVWGEGGHIYSRRLRGTTPSAVYEQADVPGLSGWTEVSADEPVVAVGGDSSYADVAFHAVLRSPDGSQQQSRVLMNRLRGSAYDGVTQPDGLSTPGPEGADQPLVAMTEYGRGFATSSRNVTQQVVAERLGDNGSSAGVQRVDSLPNATAPDVVPAVAGLISTMIAWQHEPGGSGAPEIRLRYALDGSNLGPELVLSNPSLGPTDAADGLAAGGDISGDGVAAWLQGSPGATQIVTAQLYKSPGGPGPLSSLRFVANPRPTLAWSGAYDLWGPIRYLVRVDGVQVAQTTATSFTLPAPLSNGPHRWQVIAVNRAGLSGVSSPATVFVDTVPPAATVQIIGRLRAGSSLHIYTGYTDAPAPLPAADASGIARVVVKWGDGTVVSLHQPTQHRAFHTYRRAGYYRLTVIVTDRAGNATPVSQVLHVAPKPKPKPKKKKPKPKRPAPKH
jgi:hypothetical protein